MCFFILCGETGIRPPPCFLRDGDSYVAPLLTIHSLPGGHPVQSFEHVCPLKRAWTFKPCQSLAERRGFEPRKPFWSLHAFQACLFNHSRTTRASLLRAFRRKTQYRLQNYYFFRTYARVCANFYIFFVILCRKVVVH